MIDVHCHLENEDYNKDRDELIEKYKEELSAVITSCANPRDFELTMNLIKKYKNFVFGTFSVHPIYIKEISQEQKQRYFKKLREKKDKIVAIGETGLDYYRIRKNKWREKQKELLKEHIKLAKELSKPLVIHSRDSCSDALDILEDSSVQKVDFHMFSGRKYLERVKKNDWNISMNAIVLRSKNHKKIIRDMPLEKIMLETDSPWLAPGSGRNTSLTIKKVAEKIAKIKKVDYEEVWKKCGKNAVKFFDLPITL